MPKFLTVRTCASVQRLSSARKSGAAKGGTSLEPTMQPHNGGRLWKIAKSFVGEPIRAFGLLAQKYPLRIGVGTTVFKTAAADLFAQKVRGGERSCAPLQKGLHDPRLTTQVSTGNEPAHLLEGLIPMHSLSRLWPDMSRRWDEHVLSSQHWVASSVT